MVTIADRLNSAYDRILNAAHLSGRNSADVQLLAVSKTKPISLIVDAYQQGHRQFGESYVQEAVEKIQTLQDKQNIEWHFIGPIQSNKSRLIAEHFDWVQSVDREKIARRLNEQRPNNRLPLNILIQVNISEDPNKSGCLVEDIQQLAELIDSSRQLTLRGLMAIPAKTENPEQQQQDFNRLNQAFEQLAARYRTVDTLSMGMSGDLEPAIAAGSTMVRLGTAIFGERVKKNSD